MRYEYPRIVFYFYILFLALERIKIQMGDKKDTLPNFLARNETGGYMYVTLFNINCAIELISYKHLSKIFFFLTMYFGLPSYTPPRLLGETGVRRHWSTKYIL
jgi:hypothetical protein